MACPKHYFDIIFSKSVNDIFLNFNEDTQPVAAASLGQVYRLKLKNSKSNGWVAVKVQRPDMLHSVLRDIFIMR
jgi:predicted unusual protein kinase regulating ubiquinone biosynthesis (AarF/ABC1/UbiB family)